MQPRRSRFKSLAFVLLVVMPIIEIVVIVMVGRAIGGWRTFALLVLCSFVGAWLVKAQWRTAWRSLREALQTGKTPARELTDAALVLIGGALLLVPGFVSSVLGFLLVLPFTRPLTRPLLQAAIARRVLASTTFVAAAPPPGAAWTEPGTARRSNRTDDEVIEGEIIDDDQ